MKRVYLICLFTSVFMVLACFLIHSSVKKDARHIKIGFVYVGDEMTPYTKNFMNAQEMVEQKYGDMVECSVKYNVAEDACEGPIRELVNEKCDYIIAPSYGYSTVTKELAKEYPNIQFCVPTGDNANTGDVLENYHNCMGTIYQGRYVCGIVAGMKIKEMIEEGVIEPSQAKIGYVAAFPYSEVISGYTAFFLGVRSIVPEATMLVKYADTWSSYVLEKKIANELIENGCVVISQHSDTTGPAIACENADMDYPVYHVGYNQSMTDIAPTSSLISCCVDYSRYFLESTEAVINQKKIEDVVDAKVVGMDSMAGFDREWIRVFDVNKAIAAEGTEEAIAGAIKQFEKGDFQVFKGNYIGTNPFDENDTIDLTSGYIENYSSSSPTFKYVLDDVIEVLQD